MKRLWPVGLATAAAVHAIVTLNAAGFQVALWFGVAYVAALGWRGRDRRVPPLTRDQLWDRGVAPPWPHDHRTWDDLYRQDAEGESSTPEVTR